MRVISVDCNHCGAPLDVGEKTRFVTCRYCSKRLSIQHSESSVYTEVLDDLKDTTEKLSEDMEVLKMQNQLGQLDREWQMEREQFMISTKNGGKTTPGTGFGGLVGGLGAAGFGLFFVTMASGMGAGGIFPLFGVVMIVSGLVGAVTAMNKAGGYQEAEKRYRRHRGQMTQQLNRLKKR